MNLALRNGFLLASYLRYWRLEAGGAPMFTAHSALSQVRDGQRRGVLKVTQEPEELAGIDLMQWWDGDGACRVLRRHGPALLLPAADPARSLVAMSRDGQDDDATRILCDVIAALHAPRPTPPPKLPALADVFAPLTSALTHATTVEAACAGIARAVLKQDGECVALHGDIHHANVLWFADQGWAAIDAKGMFGPRGFDYANLFCNPPMAQPGAFRNRVLACFDARLATVSRLSRLAPELVLQWVAAWCGLSALWMREDAVHPWRPLLAGALAVRRLR